MMVGMDGDERILPPFHYSNTPIRHLIEEVSSWILEQAADWILQSRRLVVFTGAGLSTESGIPDFRSPGGVWSRYNPADFDFQNFLASEASREKYWQMATEMYASIREARPNAAHLAIYELDRLGKLEVVITQNIDGLHEKAGHGADKIIELHGTALHVSCLNCGKRYDRDEIQERIKQGIKAPACDDCQGPLKPATISFGQAMPERETREAYRRSALRSVYRHRLFPGGPTGRLPAAGGQTERRPTGDYQPGPDPLR